MYVKLKERFILYFSLTYDLNLVKIKHKIKRTFNNKNISYYNLCLFVLLCNIHNNKLKRKI